MLRRIKQFLCFVDDLMEVVLVLAWRAATRRPMTMGLCLALVLGAMVQSRTTAVLDEDVLMGAEDEAELERMMMEEADPAPLRSPNIGIWAIRPGPGGFTCDLAFARRVYDAARPGTVLFQGAVPKFVVVRVASRSLQVMDVDDRSLHLVEAQFPSNGMARIGDLRVSALVHTSTGKDFAVIEWQGRSWTVGQGTVVPGAAAPDTAPTFVVTGVEAGRVLMHELATGRFVTAGLGGR